jgi:hypothetical protein
MNPLQIIALAQRFSPQKTPNMRVNGPTDVLQSLLVFQPAETGWHIRPGPVLVVVKSGAFTETHANGCITVHPAGVHVAAFPPLRINRPPEQSHRPHRHALGAGDQLVAVTLTGACFRFSSVLCDVAI